MTPSSPLARRTVRLVAGGIVALAIALTANPADAAPSWWWRRHHHYPRPTPRPSPTTTAPRPTTTVAPRPTTTTAPRPTTTLAPRPTTTTEKKPDMTIPPPTTTTAPRPTTTVAPSNTRYAVGSTSFTFVDASRSNRSLSTYVKYPATANGTNAPAAAGRFPLVVVGHGLGQNGQTAVSYMNFLVEAGYVVAAPTFPEGSQGNTSALTKQPGDVSFVITRMLEASSTGFGLGRDSIEPTLVAYYGTSWGGMTGMLFYNDAYDDARIKALAIRMGNVRPSGTMRWNGPPLLMVHGDRDNVVDYDLARDNFAEVASPKGFITLAGAGHDMSGNYGILSQNASRAFFDYYVKGQSNGLDRVRGEVAKYSFASFIDGY